MSEQKQREILENINRLPEEKKQYIFGYVEGITQMSEKNRKDAESQEQE